jgi:TetR/AcrR family transcriptional regulator
MGVESSETRELLLNAAERLMREGGYPAVTTRRLASEVGVSNQLVHYYFRTMDDLFLSLMRRHADLNMRRVLDALASDEPVRALWELYSDPEAARLAVEIVALANHRKVINEEAARHAEQLRALETEALSRVMSSCGIDPQEFPAVSLSLLMASIPRTMVMETAMGVSIGHAETEALIERYLGMLHSRSRSGRRRDARSGSSTPSGSSKSSPASKPAARRRKGN